MKRLFLLTLAVLTCVFAKSEIQTWTDANGTTWRFDTSEEYTATLCGYYDGSAVTSIPCVSGTIPNTLVIPSVVYVDETAYTVTSLGEDVFYGCNNLTSITIPAGVTRIGRYAFYHCTRLTSINIPEEVTWIEGGAFEGCSALTSITIPEGVREIEAGAFRNCI